MKPDPTPWVALIYILMPAVPIIGDVGAVVGLCTMVGLCLWGLLIVKAVSGEAYRLPCVGDLAHTMSSR
ncbi:MAG: hypothetical protein FJW21_01440 [Acidimicrobiia bacterium]|nr:hypothetical protein [Acidimicrobiia bacterium]